ncbi:MAG: hypothetical protein K2J80_02165 [Oscillospiraceae bacterium]|nr:hypothetical protein [Oscillospiraceae bacterium]
MKKRITIISVLLAATLLGGCSGNPASPSVPSINTSGNSSTGSVSFASGSTGNHSSNDVSQASDSDSSDLPAPPASTGAPIVYMTTNITSQGLLDIYAALNASPSGKIAVKLSTGEPGSNYLRTDLN